MMAFKVAVPPSEGQRLTEACAEAMIGQMVPVKFAGYDESRTGRVQFAEITLEGWLSLTIVADVPEALREFLIHDSGEGVSAAPIEEPAPEPEPEPRLRGVSDDAEAVRAQQANDKPGQQHSVYLVLSEEERARGFTRPLRRSYIHVGPPDGPKGCGVETTMGLALCETYATNPHFYGATWCVGCNDHLPVGENGEFVWAEDGERVGT